MASTGNFRSVAIACLVGLMVGVLSSITVRRLDAEELPPPIFYLPLDDSISASVAQGNPFPELAQEDSILALADVQGSRLSPGKVGRCMDLARGPLVFHGAGNFRPDEGACAFWVRPNFRGDDTNLYAQFFGVSGWGMVYKYLNQTYLTFITLNEDGTAAYLGGGDIASWRPGEWHHVVVCWSREGDYRKTYLDGAAKSQRDFKSHVENAEAVLNVGTGTTGSGWQQEPAYAAMDEVAIWDGPLTDAEIAELYQRGRDATPILPATEEPNGTLDVASSNPVRPAPPANSTKDPYQIGGRPIVPLDGWWPLLPSDVRLQQLPAEGWGLAHVPGYWTGEGLYSEDGHWKPGTSAIDPNNEPAVGAWNGRPMSDFVVGYHLRTFVAEPDWQNKNVFLQLDGVDGLAEVYFNGRRLGWLPAWESESFEISNDLRFDAENTLVIGLHRQKLGSKSQPARRRSGLYGSVSLSIAPQAFLNDTVVRPSVAMGQVRFTCDVWSPQTADAELVFEIVEQSAPERVVQRLVHSFRLTGHDGSVATLSEQLQRVECSFPWPDAHLWTYDDPFLYEVRTSLAVDGTEIDSPPPVSFGFCEFERRGSEFYLNGKPTHLRGHQIGFQVLHDNVAIENEYYIWDPWRAIRNLKPAGANCFELGAPLAYSWNVSKPYRGPLCTDLLDYADGHGILALPVLPDARQLKTRITEPAVSQLYRRRLDKHIRRFGNHPSVAMWFMHFNLAGYPWYMAPTKIDGSHKPFDAAFQEEEQYAVHAQHIAQTIDGRPLFHHACGNFGDMFTLNCYIGPTSPLQEREEWPSRWSEKRPFPLLACEHGLMLQPYWYRARTGDPNVSYASEPLFDEIAAIYVGRSTYQQITPELFDLYVSYPQRTALSRLWAIVPKHEPYKQVKALFAQRSLRAWRTYGVSGIVFNAELWELYDANGNPRPYSQTMARYFGDTDLYVAGPEGNWESKDHSFFAGEKISKQVVLLNDLTRDLTCTLKWRLEDANGVSTTPVTIAAAIARAGKPTMYPFEFQAPAVSERTSFKLVIEPDNQAGASFQADGFPLEVFPAADRPAIQSKVFVFDATGDTTRMLERAGIDAQPLAAQSDLCGRALVIVGRQSWNDAFLQLAEQLKLDEKIRQGLNVLVMEQTGGSPFGLQLTERSTRNTFIASPQHAFLAGLDAEDFINLRGVSDVIEAYPPAPPGTELKYPERFFKWSNRGVVATYVYTKPHYAPFVPILESGFDLVESPLLQATMGTGQVVLCQVDVTPRYGSDPVSTRLVDNLLGSLGMPGGQPQVTVAHSGDAAREFLAPFRIASEPFDLAQPAKCGLIVVGPKANRDEAEIVALNSAANQGATVLLLPDAPASAFGLQLADRPDTFIGHFTASAEFPNGSYPLLRGVSDSDLYLRDKRTMRAAQPTAGWQDLIDPGMLSVKTVGAGQILACQLDLAAPGTRGQVKALRLWNLLLTNLHAGRSANSLSPNPNVKVYETNQWEQMPRYIHW